MTVGLLSGTGSDARALVLEQRLFVKRVEQAVDDITAIEGKRLTRCVGIGSEGFARERCSGRVKNHDPFELGLPRFGESYIGREGQIPAAPKFHTSVRGDCRR